MDQVMRLTTSMWLLIDWFIWLIGARVAVYLVTGCANPRLPRLTWMSRRQDTLTVFCNQTSERWHLVCKGNTWVGSYGNCTRGKPKFTFPSLPTSPFAAAAGNLYGFRRRLMPNSRQNSDVPGYIHSVTATPLDRRVEPHFTFFLNDTLKSRKNH